MQRSCDRKNAYGKQTAERVLKRNKLMFPGLKLRVYKCECGRWHLTHKKGYIRDRKA